MLAPFKVPASEQVLDEMPTTSSTHGLKVRKKVLAALAHQHRRPICPSVD
ncbi:hypothetical protein [Actinomycetospora sp. TBRC 11914]|nr:hypothetical protein [Actinomycetospora sp. TBRC 11914]NMO88623.1 hypothetical protein [Actinomycetospora sp. TBRC 11914]